MFEQGKCYMTRGGRAVTIETVGSKLVGRVHYASGDRIETWSKNGRRNRARKSPLDLTTYEADMFSTPFRQPVTGYVIVNKATGNPLPVFAASRETMERVFGKDKDVEIVAVGETLGDCQIIGGRNL